MRLLETIWITFCLLVILAIFALGVIWLMHHLIWLAGIMFVIGVGCIGYAVYQLLG
jgi:hypothetical protein